MKTKTTLAALLLAAVIALSGSDAKAEKPVYFAFSDQVEHTDYLDRTYRDLVRYTANELKRRGYSPIKKWPQGKNCRSIAIQFISTESGKLLSIGYVATTASGGIVSFGSVPINGPVNTQYIARSIVGDCLF